MLSSRKLRRFLEMDLYELRFRLSQRARIARERMTLARVNGLRPGWSTFWETKRVEDSRLRHALESHDEGAAAGLLRQYLPERLIDRFCPLISDSKELVETYRQLFPGRTEQIIEKAEQLRNHRMRIFAYAEANCGVSIPWRQDVIHGIDSELAHWSRIPFLDFKRVGDSKITWEPNRHQHFVTLALAYRLTGNEAYAEECFTQWEDWQFQNPYLQGINWASSLELAFRTWSWIWMVHLLAGSRAMTGQRLAELIGGLSLHAEFIAANLSTYYSPNTHLLGEGFALFIIGLLFPELRDSETHRETGRTILIEEISRQVRADGSHAEQSTCYHRYATDFFLCAAILADRNRCAFPTSYRSALERMVDFSMFTAWPNGSHPMIGDSDGGRLLPFGLHDPNDHRSTLSTAAVYFEREDFRHRAWLFSEETLWLLGPEAADRFRGLTPVPPTEISKAFRPSGLVVMRSDWASGSNMLVFDAGPQGMDGCGHGHADALSVACSAQGTNWLVDPGTFVYTSSHEWRNYFRSTTAHNTLVVDGQGQAQPSGIFKWLNLCPARLECWDFIAKSRLCERDARRV